MITFEELELLAKTATQRDSLEPSPERQLQIIEAARTKLGREGETILIALNEVKSLREERLDILNGAGKIVGNIAEASSESIIELTRQRDALQQNCSALIEMIELMSAIPRMSDEQLRELVANCKTVIATQKKS